MQPSQIVNRLSLKGTFIIKTRFSKLPFFSYRLNENMKSFKGKMKVRFNIPSSNFFAKMVMTVMISMVMMMMMMRMVNVDDDDEEEEEEDGEC